MDQLGYGLHPGGERRPWFYNATGLTLTHSSTRLRNNCIYICHPSPPPGTPIATLQDKFPAWGQTLHTASAGAQAPSLLRYGAAETSLVYVGAAGASVAQAIAGCVDGGSCVQVGGFTTTYHTGSPTELHFVVRSHLW